MKYRIGMIIEGKISGIQPYGAFVTLDDHTQGLIHISECKNGYVEDIHKILQVGQRVRVMVIDVDEYSGKISLSLRCLEKPFNFKVERNFSRSRHKKYWTNYHLEEGFKPIAQRLDGWVKTALADIKAGK